jgi:diacylglycerol kinase family enzyme
VFAVLLNAASGSADRAPLREEIEKLFAEAGVEARVRVLTHPCDIAVAAREALDGHSEALVAGGGDGTVSAIASVLSGTPTPLGVLPLGTLNHFAKDAGIPLDLPGAVRTIADRRTKRIDVGRVNDHVFVNNSSIGVYPSLVEARERLRAQGMWKWTALVRATADVLRREGEMTIQLERKRTTVDARTPFVFVGNNEYLVEGIRLGARTRLDAGMLYAYFAPPVCTRDLPKLFARALFGVARREHALESISGREFWIDTPFASTFQVACDGEVLTLASPLHYQSWPGALTVFAPAA